MCGVYGLSQAIKLDFQYRFHLESDRLLRDLPAFQFYPGSQIPTVVKNSPPAIKLMTWGLVPPWMNSKDDLKFPTHNCRVEGFEEKPSWRHAWKHSQRCLIIGTHFFEWKREGEGKQAKKTPYIIRVKGEPVFAFAGLYEVHGDSYSCTMFTAESEGNFAKIHHRVPVILAKEDEDTWVDKETPIDTARALLRAPKDSTLEIALGSPAG